MAQTVKNGDILHYARQDSGGGIAWHTDREGNLTHDPDKGEKGGWIFQGTLGHIAGAKALPPEDIVAGLDIPLPLCERLVEDKICVVARPAVVAPAEAAPETGDPPAEPAPAPAGAGKKK